MGMKHLFILSLCFSLSLGAFCREWEKVGNRPNLVTSLLPPCQDASCNLQEQPSYLALDLRTPEKVYV